MKKETRKNVEKNNLSVECYSILTVHQGSEVVGLIDIHHVNNFPSQRHQSIGGYKNEI